MRAISGALQAHLDGNALTLTTCWRVVRRDDAVFRFTEHDVDLVVAGETYISVAGYFRSAINSGSGLEVGDAEVDGVHDPSTVTDDDVRAGLWDYATVEVFAVNWADLTMGSAPLRKGWLGEFISDDQFRFRVELRGLAQPLQQPVGEVYTAECRADLGDARCKVPIEPTVIVRSYPYVVDQVARVPVGIAGTREDDNGLIWRCTTAGTTAGTQPGGYAGAAADDTVTDGSAVFTAEDAWTIYAEVDVPGGTPSTFTFDPVWLTQARQTGTFFDQGLVVFESGFNDGVAREVLTVAIGGTVAVTLFSPAPFPILAGDALRISPGCDKSKATCKVKYVNLNNMRAEPEVPGEDAMRVVGMPV